MQSCRGTYFHVATEFLRTNDPSNAVLNYNQVLYNNNPTSVAETNSSEKEITNDEEQQESSSNNSQSETLQIFENLNSMENVSEPDFDIQVVLILPTNYRLANHNLLQPLT